MVLVEFMSRMPYIPIMQNKFHTIRMKKERKKKEEKLKINIKKRKRDKR